MKVIIAAGGTGGHIYPGIAIAEELKMRDPKCEILFVGSREGMEGELVKRERFEIKLIHARALLRKLSYKALSAPFVAIIGFFESMNILRSFRPNILVVTGGYVSFPVIAAAVLLKIPYLLHEENVLPGFTNKFWANYAKVVTLSFPETVKYLKGSVTGNPLRKRILSIVHKGGKRKNALILGGSQGALSINKAIAGNLEELKEFEVTHIIGRRDFDCILGGIDLSFYPFYRPVAYMYNIEEALASADLVVSRAGATAISEILSAGLPSILVPFPYSAEGHQDKNAAVLGEAGAARILADSGLGNLANEIKSILRDDALLMKMKRAAEGLSNKDAAKKIVDLIYAAS